MAHQHNATLSITGQWILIEPDRDGFCDIDHASRKNHDAPDGVQTNPAVVDRLLDSTRRRGSKGLGEPDLVDLTVITDDQLRVLKLVPRGAVPAGGSVVGRLRGSRHLGIDRNPRKAREHNHQRANADRSAGTGHVNLPPHEPASAWGIRVDDLCYVTRADGLLRPSVDRWQLFFLERCDGAIQDSLEGHRDGCAPATLAWQAASYDRLRSRKSPRNLASISSRRRYRRRRGRGSLRVSA